MKCIFTLFLVLIGATAAAAQSATSSGEIAGTVRDPSGAVIANGQISVTNVGTGLQRSAVTNSAGEYRVLLLPPGRYEVKAEFEGFNSQVGRSVDVRVGETSVMNFELKLGQRIEIDVIAYMPLIDVERSRQASTIVEEDIRRLPIDRRDYLSYTLLAPGVVDSTALADNNDFRVPQTRDSGLSFYGSNGRGNNVTVDGGEANDSAGGVRQTISQEAVQEFQINRGNYSAEFGGASGAVINIVSKSGANNFSGSVYGFFRHDSLDAADPFATNLVNDRPVRVDPPSNRQQYGATLGGPLRRNRTLFFASFEGLRRRESNSVPVLTDVSIFGPTADQERILTGLPIESATPLRAALTSSTATRNIFRTNSGVFPFSSDEYKTSIRLDEHHSSSNQFLFRYNGISTEESNPNIRALVGFSRGYIIDSIDHTGLLSWTHVKSPKTVNQFRVQFNYRNFFVSTTDPFGPELNVNGFGYFNRDFALPSYSITRRTELSEVFSFVRGRHELRAGGTALVRAHHNDVKVFMGGRFTFGALPGSLVSPALASTTITAVQAFNLGLPQSYQQGFGDPVVASTLPFYGAFLQDHWRVSPTLTVDVGLRYELEIRTSPIRRDGNNFAPRIGIAWNALNNGKTVVRAAYGLFYSPHYFQADFVARALSNLNGRRQVAQLFTTIQTPGIASASNIYRTLLAQNVIQIPKSTRGITADDIAQFGLKPVHDGPLPPQTVLFGVADDFSNPYSQQSSLGVEHALTDRWVIGASYLYASTLKMLRARDRNLLPAPVSPALGIRLWTAANFRDPLLLQENLYESSARSFYNALVVEATKRFSSHFSTNFNYTFSKAIDDVVDFNADFQAMDQTNLRAERALSAFDQRHKFVFYGTLETGSIGQSRFRPIFSNLTVTPIVRANSGRPFNLLVGFDLNGDRHPTTDRPAFAGRNTGTGPAFWTTDLRLTKTVSIGEKRVEFIGEAFNVLNRLNFQSVNTTVGNMAGPFNVRGREDRTPSEPLGFTSAFDGRRIQLGLRFRY